MYTNVANTADLHDDRNKERADESIVVPAEEVRNELDQIFNTPQLEGPDAILPNGQISISGYKYDGYVIRNYNGNRRTVSIMDFGNSGNAVVFFDVPIDHLAAAMKAKRESTMPTLKEGKAVLAMSSDGKVREGWRLRKHPSDPNAVALVGTKNGLTAYSTYDHEHDLQQESAMVQAVVEYTKRDFEMHFPPSGALEGGWRVTHIVEPNTNRLRAYNARIGQEKFFDSVDHFLIEVKIAEMEAKANETHEKKRREYSVMARTPKHIAYTAVIGTNRVTPVNPEKDEYLGRTRITSTSGNIDGQVYMPQGLEHKMEAIVVDTTRDPVLRAYIEEVTNLLGLSLKGVKTPPVDLVLSIIANKIRSDFPYAKRMLDKEYAKTQCTPGQKHYLGQFMKKYEESNMVCRHMGLLATIIIEKIKAHPEHSKLLPEKFACNFMGDQSETKNDRNGHAYAIVAADSPLQGMKYYYLDPANGAQSMGEVGVDLKNENMREDEARYLFSLLRTIFNKPDPVHTLFLQRVFGIAESNPALKKIARSALSETKAPESRAAVRAFRKKMGLSENI